MNDPRLSISRFASLLVPGWKVTFSRCRAEKMPIRGALAVCNPTPTRSLAHLYIVDPWPAGEDMEETIAHELTHAALSPFTTLLQDHPAAVMLEEQAVENIGKGLASAPRAARALARAVSLVSRLALRSRRNPSCTKPGRREIVAITAQHGNDGAECGAMVEDGTTIPAGYSNGGDPASRGSGG